MHSILKFNISRYKYWVKVLPLLVLGAIIFNLINSDKIGISFDFIADIHWDKSTFLFLISVLGLMLINWSLEALKWKVLLQPFQKMSFLRAFQSIWSGVSTALITPNRFGDFIGRLTYLPGYYRKKGLISSFYGSYSQGLITLIMGWIGWMFFSEQIVELTSLRIIISCIGFLSILILIILFFSKKLASIIPKKWRPVYADSPGNGIKTKIIALSFFRYLVFATQFYLLIQFFGVDLSYSTVFMKTTLFYLIIAFVPMTFWGEIGIKESVAVWVFSGLIYNSLIIIAVTVLLWLINLIIPAIVGNYFLLKTISLKQK